MTPRRSPSSTSDRGVLPPRWFIRAAWVLHRGLVTVSRGRVGLWAPRAGRSGMLLLTTTGRRTGTPRRVVLAYIEDGPDLVTLAMNGWAPAEPAWWLNLRAHPDARVQLAGESRPVRARAAVGKERERLWGRWAQIDAELDSYATRRPGPTAVVVLAPRVPGDRPATDGADQKAT